MEVKKAGTEYITVIRSLAMLTWAVAYKEILSASQISYMLELFYSPESLQKQIEEQGHQFILISREESTVGFASWSVKNEEEPTIYRLHKIYIDPNQQGKGNGKILLDHI